MRSSKNGVRLLPTASRRTCTSSACTALGSNFSGVMRGGLAKQVLVYRDFADIVQISCRAKCRNVAGLHAHGFSYSRGVASNAQRVTVNVYMLDVNGGRESFE